MGGDWELQDTDASTVDPSDDDDLEATYISRPSVPSSSRGTDHVARIDPDTPRPASRTPIKQPSSPAEVDSTLINITESDSGEDSFNDGEATYKQFKERKSLKRKRSAANLRREKKPRVANPESFVGRRPKRDENTPRSRPVLRKLEEEAYSDDELMEYTLPDYLQKRRAHFDRRMEHLKQSGLKLPPDFNEVEFSDDEQLEFLKERPAFRNMKPCGKYEDITLPYSLGLIPAPVAQWLRQYQVDGAAFLHELFVYQKGGILGDDMGLGKTVQVIAFLTAAYGKTGDERDAKRMRKMRRSGQDRWYPRTLIVCPGTLIQNWKSEFNRWGWWHVDTYHGDNKELALQAARSGRVEILITTYGTYLHNKDAVNMVDWDCVVADECHIIKERSSETTKAMNMINALCRIGLTGTAIQNKYEELWTLLNWTNPGKLGPVTTWRRTISEPLRIGQSHDATLYQLSKARKTAKKLVENLLPQFFLRRMKTLIADQLPKKSDRVVFCPLTDTQASAYENILDSDIIQYIKASTDKCDCGSGKKAGWCCRKFLPSGGQWQNYVFPAIAILQKLSNHLAALITQGSDSYEKQEKDKEMLEIAVPDQWEQLYRTRDSIVNYANPEFCGKWKVLRKLLKWWHANGDKVLVFSHSVRLLKMLQMLFHYTSYNVSYLDGSMSYEERTKVVDDFNSDPKQFVFLISTRSGGVGLNITSANKVVVVDPNWNPSHDLQAQDRAYRIGQSRNVEVFRLISAGTIEEIVYARQIYKQQQANIGYNASSERRYFKGVQEKKDQKGEIFGLNNLFEFQNNNIVLRDIVNKTNVAESRAGVQVMDIAVDENGTSTTMPEKTKTKGQDDEVMSQLAAMIRGDTADADNADDTASKPAATMTPQKHDPIQAILAGAGVEYTHLNNEVIGSSKVEERLSRRAELADEKLGDVQVFGSSQGGTGPQRVADRDGRPARYKFHPPRNVMKRQFCSMAKRFGFANATEFALVVEGMTQAQRRACLDRWYTERREILGRGT
ncbi:putative DNA excision repair protein (Rad26L) [Aspergillus clavatus NRRL 1]|uniref:DNA excision repair protein (Rad26L), putative n=1 Tax=Aspergillus clavatus (strain ATCC 1007 / CBS 513.65 / DSM 816 / NCTC 3887 / NRRL 1 / QM 1276 / 107) TaxID=344612 RepID=A1CET5_ASPCL|nr:DNA excision repair protein (Rad26L), putative [Aspergillus clavatus NRRL 1]EAW11384.1 DNA excision repair protein (Rad26L), putative [Aspergillus clavatus NRRL 1]